MRCCYSSEGSDETSLSILAVSSDPSLFAHIKYNNGCTVITYDRTPIIIFYVCEQ